MNNNINIRHNYYIYIKKRPKNIMKTTNYTLTPHICSLCTMW